MVDHGAKILAQVRRRGRELEAQTSIKRGYLNLVHAREAIVRHAAAAEDARRGPIAADQSPRSRPTRRCQPSRALTTPCSGILVAHHKW